MYFARQLVAERLAGAMSELPEMDEPPALGPISTGLGQIFIYYLTLDDTVDTAGKDANTYLRELNDWVVKFQLKTTPGVTDILSIGGHVLQYQIRVDPDALLRYRLSLDDLVEAVRSNNANVGGQFLVIGSEESLVRGLGLLEDLEDIRGIPIKVEDGVAIRLSDVAEVAYGNEIRRGVVSHNGQAEVVSGIVLKLFGEEHVRGHRTPLQEGGTAFAPRCRPAYRSSRITSRRNSWSRPRGPSKRRCYRVRRWFS